MRKKPDKDKARDYKERFYKKQRELGLCLECMNPTSAGHSRCDMHLSRRQEKLNDARQRATSKGICTECFIKPSMLDNKRCANCYIKRISQRHFGTTTCWEQLKKKLEVQQGKCALSGFPLTLGLNAELDHIKPTSKQGCRDISNTQWVLKAVNRMKDHMLEDDFYELIRGLYKHMTKNRRT